MDGPNFTRDWHEWFALWRKPAKCGVKIVKKWNGIPIKNREKQVDFSQFTEYNGFKQCSVFPREFVALGNISCKF